jgi:hypothetical protein
LFFASYKCEIPDIHEAHRKILKTLFFFFICDIIINRYETICEVLDEKRQSKENRALANDRFCDCRVMDPVHVVEKGYYDHLYYNAERADRTPDCHNGCRFLDEGCGHRRRPFVDQMDRFQISKETMKTKNNPDRQKSVGAFHLLGDNNQLLLLFLFL